MTMIAELLIVASMCLQGGEQMDVSQYVSSTASRLELRVTLNPANSILVIYSPRYEEQQARFSQAQSFGWIAFAEPILCIKPIGGPFKFNIDILPIEAAD
jgi:hypothetical protein